jgi:hypothetical protein
VAVKRYVNDEWITISGLQGPVGATGSTGATGATGVYRGNSAPGDTSLLWVDLDDTNSFVPYTAPTIGSTSIASGSTVTTIAGLTLTTPNIGAATATSLTTTGGSLLTRAASTQDGVEIRGRAGGTGNWEVILTPTTLSADRTLTLPNETGTLLSTAQFSAKGTILVGTGSGTLAAQTVGTNGQVLTANSAQADGVEWTTLDALPSQTGNSGKYLTTNGTAASWSTIVTDPSPSIFMLMGA